ncbi:hypothetical protein COOONC_18781, partial [Cooperia oncophora]
AYNREDKLVGAIGVIRNVKDYFAVNCLHPEEQKLISNFRRTCYITTLMVASEYRKIGIGTQLLQRASTVLLQEGSQLVSGNRSIPPIDTFSNQWFFRYIYMYYTQTCPQSAFMRKWDMKELQKFQSMSCSCPESLLKAL